MGVSTASKKLKPLPRWLRFKTHGGTDYFYDPTNEMVHYLAGGASKQNYAVDPVNNRTYIYDSFEHLQAQMEQAAMPQDESVPVDGSAGRVLLLAARVCSGDQRDWLSSKSKRLSSHEA